MNLPLLAMDLSDRKPIILAVDDNIDNLVLLNYQLEALLDCSVMTASCGEDALFLIHETMPDLVLLDMVMPDLDGVQIVQKVRSHPITATIPVVAVTACARSEDRIRFLESGCNDFLAKPYDLNDLEIIIHRHLHQCLHP